MTCALGKRCVISVLPRSTGHARAARPPCLLRPQGLPLPRLRQERPSCPPPPSQGPLPGLPPGRLARHPLCGVQGALPLLQDLPLLAPRRPCQGWLRRPRPSGRPRPHPRGRPQRPTYPCCHETRLLPGVVRGLHLRLPALEDRPARLTGAPPTGAEEVLRDPVS